MAAVRKGANIMIVDDTPANLRLLEGILSEEGYNVRPFPGGRFALKAAQNDPPDLILLDINMPEMNGYEVCTKFKSEEKTRDIPIIFISALNEVKDKMEAFSTGGVDYITKPFQFEEVQARVDTHLQLHYLRMELERHNNELESLVQEKIREILSAKEEISQAQLATIVAMSKIAESRDDDTGKHIERVQAFCQILSDKMSEYSEYQDVVDAEYMRNLAQASPLHDIGKVGIPDSVLCKPGKLTDEESDIMRTHTVLGSETLEAVQSEYPNNAFINMGIDVARSHHEKWNGKGYPDGLAGDDIPLCARIMAIADVYDALRSERCYKEGFPHEKSRDIIIGGAGTHFDPDLCEIFKKVELDFKATHKLMNT
jgi:putative two-component system response regulator